MKSLLLYLRWPWFGSEIEEQIPNVRPRDEGMTRIREEVGKWLFPMELYSHLKRLGAGDFDRGIKIAAEACGVKPRTIERWSRGKGTPTEATKYNAIAILRETKSVRSPTA